MPKHVVSQAVTQVPIMPGLLDFIDVVWPKAGSTKLTRSGEVFFFSERLFAAHFLDTVERFRKNLFRIVRITKNCNNFFDWSINLSHPDIDGEDAELGYLYGAFSSCFNHFQCLCAASAQPSAMFNF